jgi:hypothetical protein
MRSSASDFSRANKSKDRVVFSHDGFSSYLLVVDEASWYIWVFLTRTKDPPLDMISEFLQQHRHVEGKCIRTDQGGELARSRALQDMVLRDHHYTLEPTGSDSLSKTVLWRFTTTNLESRPKPSFTDQAYWQSTGLQHLPMRSSSTIASFTPK